MCGVFFQCPYVCKDLYTNSNPFYCATKPKKINYRFHNVSQVVIFDYKYVPGVLKTMAHCDTFIDIFGDPSTPTLIGNVQSRLDIRLDAILRTPLSKHHRMSSEANVPVASSLFSSAFS